MKLFCQQERNNLLFVQWVALRNLYLHEVWNPMERLNPICLI